jgi:hypothetical protein
MMATPRGLINIVRDQGVDVLIAGGRNLYTALKARIPFLDINQERDFAYAGYGGMLELARQLCLTIESPVWSSGASAGALASPPGCPGRRRAREGARGWGSTPRPPPRSAQRGFVPGE